MEKQENEKIEKTEKKKVIKNKMILNVSQTQYEVVLEVGKKLKFKISKETESNNFDLFWTDMQIQPDQLARLKPYQKINHWPGMFSLHRKNNLGKHLMRMNKKFSHLYNFFPKTWLLPADNSEFHKQFNSKFNKTFILKPEAGCQGRGIFLVRRPCDVPSGEQFVAQRYMAKPFLIDGLKFDLRIYVLVAGVDPLRIFMYKEGMARFATEPYQPPSFSNLDNVCQHLTNYAINKDSPNFIFNTDSSKTNVGHKRSMTSVFEQMKKQGIDLEPIYEQMRILFIRTVAAAQPILAHHYKSCQPDSVKNNMCFEILGMDVMIDQKLKVNLLEVNHTPSFTTDTPFDHELKYSVIKDTINLMNFNENDKQKYSIKQKDDFQKRVMGGKKIQLTLEEKQQLIQSMQKERDDWELNNLGNFEYIMTESTTKDLKDILEYANQLYIESTGANIRRNQKKDNIEQTKNNVKPQKEIIVKEQINEKNNNVEKNIEKVIEKTNNNSKSIYEKQNNNNEKQEKQQEKDKLNYKTVEKIYQKQIQEKNEKKETNTLNQLQKMPCQVPIQTQEQILTIDKNNNLVKTERQNLKQEQEKKEQKIKKPASVKQKNDNLGIVQNKEKIARISLKPAVISFHGIDTKFMDKNREYQPRFQRKQAREE